MKSTPLYWLFGGACFLLVLIFHQGLSANPLSRLLTVYGLVEDHTLRADRWQKETGDYALIDGHTFSDKAPLSSFLVVPFYWAFRRIEGGEQQWRDQDVAGHIGVVLCGALPFAILALLLLRRGLTEGAPPRIAVWLALGAAFGTCLANYGGFYFSHELAAVLFLGSYVLACEREAHFVLAGALGGLAVLAEYPLVLTQALIFGYLLLGPQRWRRATLYGLGALPAALAMVGYNKAVTGKWLDFPYSHVNDSWVAMKTAFGIRLPDPLALLELLFGPYRGLAFYASVLLVLLPLIALRFRGPRRRRGLVLAILGVYLLFVASYFKWDGGWCVGPRHLAPFIALALYEGLGALVHVKRVRLPFAVLATWGVILSLCASATDSLPSESVRYPAFEIFFPRAWRGELNDHNLFHELGLTNARYLLVIWLGLLLLTGFALGTAFARGAPQPETILPTAS